MKPRVAAIWIGVALSIAVVYGLAMLRSRMTPVRTGTSDAFWAHACGVDLTGTASTNSSGHVHVVSNVCYYESQHMHGSVLYSVPMAEVESSLARAVQLMQQRSQPSEEPHDEIAALAAWQARPEVEQTLESLMSDLRQARVARLAKQSPSSIEAMGVYDYLFERRLQQAKWYWANHVFEFIWLVGLIWLALWPLIRSSPPWRWSVHLAPLPLLLMLPVYLGYAIFTFTSAGPSGGVLYPWIVAVAGSGGTFTTLDQQIVERLPQVLEPLSQPIGSPMALTGRGLTGPSAALVTGLVLGAVATVAAWGCRRLAARRLFPHVKP